MDEGEHEATEEADVENVDVEDVRERLGVRDAREELGPFDCGLPLGSSSGFSSGSGSGSGANGTGSPDGSIIKGGKPQTGGKVKPVPHPNIDRNLANIPDPHPRRFGSVGLPPRPDITIP